MPSLSSFKRWLTLTLVVLLAHLGLLQSMPLALGVAGQLPDAPMMFSTRTIHTESPAAEVLTPTAVVRVKRPAPAKPRLAPATRVVQAAESPAPDSTPTAPDNAVADNTELLAAAQPPDTVADAEPEPAPPPPRPPRHNKPVKFSVASLSDSARLVYTVKTNKFPFSLNGELLWRHSDTTYTAKLSYSAFGQTRSQTSQGHISDGGLAPERFADKYRSEVAAHFNYPLGKVTFSANTPDAPLLAGAQDRLSVLVQLGALVASEPSHYGPGVTLTLQTVGPRDADLWLFTVGNQEQLDLPGGTVQGLKLERVPREPFDQKVEVWLSPQLGYLPARIRITETNGDSIDQQWAATEAAPAPE
jgi:hypothetical protein